MDNIIKRLKKVMKQKGIKGWLKPVDNSTRKS